MALRVARGLFRLWLVLSVLWIGGVGFVTWQTFPEEYVLPSTGMFADIPSEPGFRDKKRWEAVGSASIVALLPPAFVLAFGSALVWAFRGFR